MDYTHILNNIYQRRTDGELIADIDREIAKLAAEWTADRERQNLPTDNNPYQLFNNSPQGSLRRLLNSALITPFKELERLVVENILPSMFITTAIGNALDLHAKNQNVSRHTASKTKGRITVENLTINPLTVSAGKKIFSEPIEGQRLNLIITETKTIPASKAEFMAVEAEATGKKYNLAPNQFTASDLPRASFRVNNQVGWILAAGQDNESDDDFRARLLKSYNVRAFAPRWEDYRYLLAQQLRISPNNIIFELKKDQAATATAHVWRDVNPFSDAEITDGNSAIKQNGLLGLSDNLTIQKIATKKVALKVSVWFAPETDETRSNGIIQECKSLLGAMFRLNHGYTDAPRFAPYGEVARSVIEHHIHKNFAEVSRVLVSQHDGNKFNDIQLGLELPQLELEVTKGT